MTIAFRCPKCRTTFQVEDEMAGQIHVCTSCDTQLKVPSPGATPASNWDGYNQEEQAAGRSPTVDASRQEEAWHSPYAPPQADMQPPSAAKSSPEFYRPANGLVGALTVLFVLNALFGVVFVFLDAAHLTVDISALGIIDTGNGTSLTVFDIVYGLCGVAAAVTYLTTSVCYLFWVHRANKNSRALGALGMEFTPGWCVGWWFIPIANLFKPFQAVREIYLASSPTATSTSWKGSPAPSLLGMWWGLWIIGNILSNVEGRMAMQDDADLILASSAVGIVASLVGIGAAVTALQVVRQIHQRQNEKARRGE